MCPDHTGRYIYCTGYRDSVLIVMDTRRDSVLTRIPLPSSTFGPPLLNRATNRVYPSESGDPIPVIRDSMLAGLQERDFGNCVMSCHPTIMRRSAPMMSATAAELWNVSGRRAAVLRPGQNDLGRLAPGVYFVREEPQASGRKTEPVRKVVLTE